MALWLKTADLASPLLPRPSARARGGGYSLLAGAGAAGPCVVSTGLWFICYLPLATLPHPGPGPGHRPFAIYIYRVFAVCVLLPGPGPGLGQGQGPGARAKAKGHGPGTASCQLPGARGRGFFAGYQGSVFDSVFNQPSPVDLRYKLPGVGKRKGLWAAAAD
jgi:hypothetical protein